MQFYPYEPLDHNSCHNQLWDWIKEAFKADEGVAYYRYPVFRRSGNLLREPDVVILHRQYGLWIFECKGCKIQNIQAIQGHVWEMSNWYDSEMTPLLQAEDQMFAVQNKLNAQRETRGIVPCYFRVALPAVKRSEWEERDFYRHTESSVWVYEDLTPKALKKSIAEVVGNNPEALDDATWELAQKVLGGTLPKAQPRSIPTSTPPDSPIRVIQAIESRLKTLDETQQKIAFEVPDGPQRLRGLAGTGKTVLLAKRAAKLHIKNPDWTIGFIFFTRSLYEQVLELITLYCQEMADCKPNLNKFKVLHSWGGKSQNGYYYNLANSMTFRAKTLKDVINEIGQCSPNEGFEYCCLSLVRDALVKKNFMGLQDTLKSYGNKQILKEGTRLEDLLMESYDQNEEVIPRIYDALLVDEGQDLPAVFYKLMLASLKEPKRLYWAYDEAQGIGNSIIPESSQIFGRDQSNKPRVDVSGMYLGGISKSHRMNRCYRTPRLLLITAHAINMGVNSKTGAVQGVTNKDNWEILGYTILKGQFTDAAVAAKQTVTITREAKCSPHPIDQDDFPEKQSLGNILTYQTFGSEYEEQAWIAEQVKNDLALGFKPEDIFITALGGDKEKSYLQDMKDKLQDLHIPAYIAGVDILPGQRFPSPDIFRIDGKVTISNIFRAKGNEAWKVYVCRFQYANQPLTWKQETELEKRNEAFVGLTRARVWCVITGLDDDIFDELVEAIKTPPNLSFPAFNKRSLRRVTDEADAN